VLNHHPGSFPPVYRAVVEAGIRAGRLSAALESVASSARRLAETRRMIVAAFLYPLLVFLLAWGLFVFFVTQIAPALLPPLESFDAPARHFVAGLVQIGHSSRYWGPVVPAIVVAAALVWFSRTGRSMLLGSDSGGALLGHLPWMAAMLRSFRIAAFTDVLATLVQQEVPLGEGILLAAEAVGDRKILATSKEIAAAIERGDSPERSPPGRSSFPPLVDWLVRSGHGRGTLRDALRHASDIYYRRASRQAMAARVLLPTLSIAVIGGGITLGYAVLLFGPWMSLLYSLAEV
jgi:general secretion pathway protein F